VVADFDLRVRQRREFTNALITEVGFPALDAASKDAAHLTVRIKPEFSRLKRGAGETLLFRLDFRGVGIFSITPDKTEAGSENIRRVRIECYVEEIHFSFDFIS
jgi:hypothetical protein